MTESRAETLKYGAQVAALLLFIAAPAMLYVLFHSHTHC